DVDGDGWPDIFLTHLAGESNTLYRNRGDASFVDETAARGLHGPSLPYTGFGTGMPDLDNDGDLDIVVANGRINRGPVVPGVPEGFLQPYAEPNAVFLNDGSGHFAVPDVSVSSLSDRPGMSRGLALGDPDDDGRLDLFVLETGRELRRLESRGGAGWIGFSVTDPELGDRHAIGAVLELHVGEIHRRFVVNPNVGYLSSNDPRIHAGLGDRSRVDSVVVTWPDGGIEVYRDLPGGRYHAVRRGEGSLRS
ncbi:MAG: CRTAC1 family protein, partial [Gemmatimonadota bacterium]|nr:CRTAC1 family protein [Gemmatimonadota bacterium]